MQYSKGKQQQRGATFLGGLIIAAILGMALYVVIRLYPAYWEYYEIVSSLNSVAKENGGGAATPQSLRSALDRKWSAGYVDTIKGSDVDVTKDGDGWDMTVDYQVERPFVGNISLLVSFNKTVKVE